MMYIALALNKQGFRETAIRELLKALCSQEGSVIAENIDPFTGEINTEIYTMAYSVGLNVVLHHILTKEVWD